MSARAAPIYHCPFCGEQDLRPSEESPEAWACRSCARVFTVGLMRLDETLIPGRVASPGGDR
ncbi:MAG TPA: hypothetical protein VHM65_07620 [Candidatus Lustribacter sp.]|nr:hypothetical protein [Candidatus Lustribacter sp.]